MKNLFTKTRDLANKKRISVKSVTTSALSVLLPVLGAVLLVKFQDTLLLRMSHVVLIISAVLISISIFIIWFMAGLAVFRSLFIVGASMTLLIFISQAYCDSVGRTVESDNALGYLITFGILYIVGVFFVTLYKELFGEKNKDKKNEVEKKTFLDAVIESRQSLLKWIVGISYVVFVALFLSQFYLVLKPIFDNLCVF